MRLLRAAVLIPIACCCCTASRAGGQTIVILDVTAQMGAQLGRKPKLEWVKPGLSAAVSKLDPASAFALWAFGSNPQKKCEDAGELVPLQTAGGAAAALDKALAALRPKAARAPAIGTLQAALKSIGSPDKPVSAIVIAGTGDDCTGDICSVAGRLHTAYPNLKLNVLGVGMNEQAAANFTCAAKAMGGAFTAVKSGADLDKSLRQALPAAQTSGQPGPAHANPPEPAAQAAAANADKPAGSPADKPANANPPAGAAANAEKPAGPPVNTPDPADQPAPQEAEQAPQPPPQPEPNVVLSAVLASGMSPLDSGVTWEIYKIQTTPTGQTRIAETPLWVGGGGQAKAKLPAGRYSVRLTYGYASASGEITVGDGKTEKTLPLDAGTIAAEALQTVDGAPAGGVFFVLYRQKTAAAREELGRSSSVPALFHVNAGDYALTAFSGLARLDASVTVKAGKVSAVRMALNVGMLEIKSFAAEGPSEAVSAWHRITPAAADVAKSVTSPLWVSGPSARLQLPAGSYRIESVYGNAREERTVTITAGQTASVNVIMNAGEAKVSLPSAMSGGLCEVYAADSDHKAGPIARAAGEGLHFILKAGRYDLDCRGKDRAAQPAQTKISVVAGQVQTAKVEE